MQAIAQPWGWEGKEIMCKKEHGSQYIFNKKILSWNKILFHQHREKNEVKNKRKGFLTSWGSETLVTYKKTFTTEIIFNSKKFFKTMFLHVLKMAVSTPNLMYVHTHLQNNFNKAIKKKKDISHRSSRKPNKEKKPLQSTPPATHF